jgi:hypothetical protein
MADVEQLERLEAAWPDLDFDCEEPASVFLGAISGPDDGVGQRAVNQFALDVGIAGDLVGRPAYWDAFADAAVAAWREIEPQLDAA